MNVERVANIINPSKEETVLVKKTFKVKWQTKKCWCSLGTDNSEAARKMMKMAIISVCSLSFFACLCNKSCIGSTNDGQVVKYYS